MYCPNPDCIDYQEDGLPGEYIDSVTVCPKCETHLVPELPAGWPAGYRSPEAGDLPEEIVDLREPADHLPGIGLLVPLAAFDYPDEAEPLLDHLAAANVTALQLLDDGRDFQDKGGVATCTRVLVPESQHRIASSILAALDRG